MRLRQTDPTPTRDTTLPEVENAALMIALELEQVRWEHPNLPPRAQMQEARRRSAEAMVAAIDEVEARKASGRSTGLGGADLSLSDREMALQIYYRRWEVWLRGERMGKVLAATEKAACLRAIQRFNVSSEDQQELYVRRAKD
jgi:hypothetical protein